MWLGSAPGRRFACPRRSSSSSGVVVRRWLAMPPQKGGHMLPRDPDLFRELFQLWLRGVGVGAARHLPRDAENEGFTARRPLGIRRGEAALDQLRRERLRRLLIGSR